MHLAGCTKCSCKRPESWKRRLDVQHQTISQPVRTGLFWLLLIEFDILFEFVSQDILLGTQPRRPRVSLVTLVPGEEVVLYISSQPRQRGGAMSPLATKRSLVINTTQRHVGVKWVPEVGGIRGGGIDSHTYTSERTARPAGLLQDVFRVGAIFRTITSILTHDAACAEEGMFHGPFPQTSLVQF